MNTFDISFASKSRSRLREICGYQLVENDSLPNCDSTYLRANVNSPAIVMRPGKYVKSCLENVHDNARLSGRSEHFADMLSEVPGAFGWLSHAGTMPLHDSAFVFDEEILPIGVSILTRVAEHQLA